MKITPKNNRFLITGPQANQVALNVAGYSKFWGIILRCLGFAVALKDAQGKISTLIAKASSRR